MDVRSRSSDGVQVLERVARLIACCRLFLLPIWIGSPVALGLAFLLASFVPAGNAWAETVTVACYTAAGEFAFVGIEIPPGGHVSGHGRQNSREVEV